MLFPSRCPSMCPRSHSVYHVPFLQSATLENICSKNTHFFPSCSLAQLGSLYPLFCILSLIRSPILHFNEISNEQAVGPEMASKFPSNSKVPRVYQYCTSDSCLETWSIKHQQQICIFVGTPLSPPAKICTVIILNVGFAFLQLLL